MPTENQNSISAPNAIQARQSEVMAFDRDFADHVQNIQTNEALDFMDRMSPSAPKPTDKAVDIPAASSADAVTPQDGNYLGYEKTLKDAYSSNLADPKEGLGAPRDLALGVMQAPRSALRGAAKGVNSMLDFFNEAADLTPAITTLTEEGKSSWIPRITTRGESVDRLNKNLASEGKPLFDPSINVPVPDAPVVPTVTGNAIEAITQFATGFKVAGTAIKGTGIAANIGKGAVADLLAFDQHEQRLSNVVQEVPALQNPVTEYLAAKPDDNFAEGKLKQAIEGVVTGGVSEALFKSVALLKRGKMAAEEMKAAGVSEADLFNVPPEEKAGINLGAKNFEFLGNPEDANLLLKKQKLDAAAAEVQGAFGKPKQIPENPNPSINDFEINFSRIEGPDDIKRLMDEMVNKPELKASIDDARRGKIDQRDTLTAATDIDGFDGLLTRRVGDAFNAEQIVAARKVYYDTTAKLMDAAKRAADPTSSDIDQFNFRKILATHHAVQKEFMGVRAEAGRALAAWNIPLGGSGADNARAMKQLLNETGGAETSKELATRIASLGNNLNTSQINSITSKAAGARTREAMAEIWTMGLLTNPATHVVNLSSNAMTSVYLGMERLAMAYPKDSPVTLREGAAYFSALMDTQKLAIKNAAEAFRTGETGMGVGKIELPRVRASSREILDPEGKAGIFSKAIDGWGMVLNKYVGGSLAAGDEYSKTLLYQAQLRALATRQGIAQGLEGQPLTQHIAQAISDPSPFMRADATTFASYGTFTKELGKNGQDIQRLIARNPVLRFAVPFVRTPANIFKFTFERTPLGYLSQNIRDDIAAGGIRRTTAQTRIAMGTSIMAISTDMALNGKITGGGPSNSQEKAALRRTGWQPYSVKIGDTYYSYARLDPLATLLGMAADSSEIISNYAAYDINAQNDVENLGTAIAVAAANQVVSKTFMTGFADLMEVLSDPGRYGERYLQKYAGSIVPAGSAALERAIDPETEQVFNMMDAVRSRIPGMSDAVPPKRNVWGEPIKTFYPEENTMVGATAERMLSLFNPIYYSAERDAPVDKWMLKNGFSIDMPDKRQAFDGVRVDLSDFPKAYDRLVTLRGSELPLLKYGNQTMKQFFDNLATEQDPYGRHVGFFRAFGNDFDSQQNFINKVISDYSSAAKSQILEEFPEVSDAISAEKRNHEKANAARESILKEATK